MNTTRRLTPPRLRRRAVGRIATRLGIVTALLVVGGNVVFAAADGSGQMGQTIPTLAWIDLSDARGISLWQYELSIDFSGDLLNPGKSVASMFTDMLWRGYLGCAAIAIWFLDWVIGFDWLALITGPLTTIGDALRSVIGRFGVTSGFLTVAALVGALFIIRGAKARGIYELVVSAAVVALAGTVLTNPVELVIGDDGLIMSTRDYTLEAVGEISGQAGDTTAITSQLIDTFVRQPVQVVSFATVLDGGPCESVYDEVVAAGPHGYDDTIREAVAACDQSAGAYAAAPSMGMVASVLIQGPVGLVVMIMAILLGGGVMLALVSVMIASLKAIINLPLAILPGGARRSLAQNAAEVVIGLIEFIFALFFLALYLMVIQELYRSTDDQPSKAFAITLIFMIVGLVAFTRYRKTLRRSSERLAAVLSKPPGGPAPQPLAPAGPNLLRAAGLYGAAKTGTRLLISPTGRDAVKRIGLATAGTLSGNPALIARAAYNRGTAKTITGALRPRPAAAQAPVGPESKTESGHTVQVLPAHTRRALPPGPDTTPLEGRILEPGQGPRPQLPTRRVFIAPPAPNRNARPRTRQIPRAELDAKPETRPRLEPSSTAPPPRVTHLPTKPSQTSNRALRRRPGRTGRSRR